ncbi:putative ATP-dependent RNA helicase TDRD12 isoform X1 [Perca fluviatilis]|uniref:putative ATP-dependent RNA helicase TDRD12 isoform X1 n=1 Tax=Perca fluviatilis TaxID=8168 RepID=UPI0019665C07|nr:putative ATP-dependent RNA helicase TDRD12 isoform X1 [Perca fluviatilis]XP_039664375.1 putative ATP-dependent RNA helicase TDRD12 isoform X1 [Perca fluviatilis]XP_039664376.1 putative ATP-dependent RNA helicase TDRD12 isoform X1 [Perca fluviatilis]
MLEISHLKIESPSCLWGRVVRGPGSDAETKDQYDKLLTQMNLFYHDVTQDLRKLKPSTLEEGQVCVVYWSVRKSWCRAVVESIFMDSLSCQARCLLVDHGERVVIPSDQILIAMEPFLQLPFWVRKFHLAGIKPKTLRVSVFEKAPELIPSTQWDSSATLYLHNLLQASTQTEAVLLESKSDSTSIELYLTVRNVKICVNDDLVTKKFAYYSRESADSNGLDEVDTHPVMLSYSILTQTVGTNVKEKKPTAQTQLSPVMSQNLTAVDWLTAPSTPQSQHQLKTFEEGSRSTLTDGHLSPGSQSKNGPDAAAAAVRDSSEDTDSSLAAALTKNLSLFRFLKFLNPNSSFQQAAPSVSQHEELKDCRPEETAAASATCTGQEVLIPSNSEPETPDNQALLSMSGAESSPVKHLTDEETSRSGQSGPAEKTWRSEEDWVCSRFLEWLNPKPLNLDPDAAEDDTVVASDPRKSGILVHSALPVEPCSSLDDGPITDALRGVLRRKHYTTLSPAERYSWPAVARGCNAVIVAQNADQPLSYIAPLLTHILLNSIFTCLTSNSGPVAVLLCPGWEKAQAVYDLLEEIKATKVLHTAILLLGVGKDEAKDVRIPKNCLLLVTTPFSFVRLLSCHCFLFLRLSHLVLDEADQLFSLAPDQMATILQHFQKVITSEEKVSCPQQLVAVAKKWSSHMEGLLANHMPCPSIVMTVPEEAALYGDVHQIILMTLESSKVSVLLGALDFNPDVGQKTVIIANSAQDVEDVFKALSNKSAFCLKTHEGLTHEFDFVIQQWKRDIGPSTHVILVTNNECLKCLGIRDATCVVHYGFPTSPKVFGERLFCLAENFRNLSERGSPQDQARSPRPSRSVLLISERNASHVVGILRYLGRTNAPLPPELLSFAQGVHAARENQKTNKPFCSYLKGFGVCRDSSVCPDRHTYISQLDQSELPASGVIEVVPIYIKTASVFYGRIVQKEDGGFQSMASEMTSYYAEKKPGAHEVLEGGLYAVQEEEVFHRVKILSVPDRGGRLFFSVFARFIDVGKEEEVKSHQILQLPEQFHSLPGQAVEIIVCRVKPVDAETDWHPKVTRALCQKIRGLQHRARAVFSLGNTVFVDPMVRVTKVPGMKTVINEYNVQSEILNTGMGVSNPEHLDLLKALCQESKEAGHVTGSGNGPASLEVRIKAEEEVLAEAFRAAEANRLAQLPHLADIPHLEPCEPLNPVSPMTQSLVPEPPVPRAPKLHLGPVCVQKTLSARQAAIGQRNTHTADLKSAEQIMRIGDGELCPVTSQAACLKPKENGVNGGDDESNVQQVIGTKERDCDDSTKSFHPQARWYQTSDSAIVTVKLINPESQRCDFYPDRVVYSGRANGRTYRADLQLHGNIAADRCSWEVKSNEPILKLVKQQPGNWERLLRSKNIFVSYDMDHFVEDEDKTPNGLCFVENTGKDNWYVNSETDSDSD